MTENQLCEANGLVARFHKSRSAAEKWDLQLRLLKLGVKLDHPAPDPWGPSGGSAARIPVMKIA